MAERRIVLIDGASSPHGALPVDLESPLWRAGQSLFETLLVRPRGETGLLHEERHAERLARAAAALKWPGCPDQTELVAWMQKASRLFRARSDGYGRMRLTVAWCRSSGPPATVVSVSPYERSREPLRVVTTTVCVPMPPGPIVPKSGNRLIYAAAEREAADQGKDEALLVDAQGRVVEGAKSNLFAVIGSDLVTAPDSCGVLAGITRAAVLDLSDRSGITRRFEAIPRDALLRADGIFMTNALWGVRSVRELDGRALPASPPIVEELAKGYEACAQ